jgi:SEC-C motif/Protein of unknown function (DUF2384)
MSSKIGRNDPCPCGSGKKYKHCCGQPAVPVATPADSHEGAVALAMNWLAQHHRKGFTTALKTEIDDAVLEIFEDDEMAADAAVANLDPTVWKAICSNLTEWLLAEGDMQVKGRQQRVADLLLGPNGPQLSSGQRAWLGQLARRPLRLYDVTDVVPGVSLTVCDALATDLAPIIVDEDAGSQSLQAGMQIGARLMEVNGRHEFSGAVYPFSSSAGQDVQAMLSALAANPNLHAEDDVLSAGLTIIDGWLAQLLLPGVPPELIDSVSGEPLLFITDHYAVRDWDALAAALAAQPDVQGEREAGWDRLQGGEDGQTRPQAAINPEPGSQRVAVFYRTARLADEGRAWFDALAGDSVAFEERKVIDPQDSQSQAAEQASPTTAPLLDADTMADAIEATILRIYANWADEPIPVLQGRTPRQAMQSASGLERVNRLLRSYEDGEAEQAAQQGRRAISYQFLWDALGLQR